METDSYTLPFYHADGTIVDVPVTVVEQSDDYLLSCDLPVSNESLMSQAEDCFAALQGLRQKAERHGWRICCKGSRKNVWPSEMSRQMGGGVKAYVLELGRPALTKNLVNIFDADDPDLYTTVAEQESFAEEWFKSLGRT